MSQKLMTDSLCSLLRLLKTTGEPTVSGAALIFQRGIFFPIEANMFFLVTVPITIFLYFKLSKTQLGCKRMMESFQVLMDSAPHRSALQLVFCCLCPAFIIDIQDLRFAAWWILYLCYEVWNWIAANPSPLSYIWNFQRKMEEIVSSLNSILI